MLGAQVMRRYLGYGGRYVISRFWTHYPIILTHSVTSKCNCQCKICDVWRRQPAAAELKTEEIFRILNEAKQQNFVGYVAFGGEPLMRPDILDIFEEAHRLGLYTSLITNGTLLSNYANRLAKIVDLTWVSLDYDSDYHNIMRGSSGIFNKAIEGIKDLRRAGSRVVINCVLSQLNLDAVPRMGKITQRLDARIAFDPMEMFEGCNEDLALTSSQRQKVFSQVAALKKEGYPILNSKEFIDSTQSQEQYHCAQPRIFIKMYEDGKIKPFWCKKNPNVIGDLRKQSLGSFLQSNIYRQFREAAWDCGLCRNSCQMETSMFYSVDCFVKRIFQRKNSIMKFLVDYGGITN